MNENIDAMRDRWLEPPGETWHHEYCPLSSDKPWRPVKCECKEIRDSYLDERAEAKRKGE